LCQSDGVRRLHVGAGNHHAAVGQNRIASDLLGAAMRDDDLIGVYALVDGALIAVETIIDMLKYLVLMPVDRDFSSWPGARRPTARSL
jgi:hypothetical protein